MDIPISGLLINIASDVLSPGLTRINETFQTGFNLKETGEHIETVVSGIEDVASTPASLWKFLSSVNNTVQTQIDNTTTTFHHAIDAVNGQLNASLLLLDNVSGI